MEPKFCEPINSKNFQELLAVTDAVFFDCDGTLWRGEEIIPGAVSLTKRLLEMGKYVGYATNYSCRTHAEMVRVMEKRGFPTKELDLVMCTSRATALCLAEKIPNGTAFVLADSGVEQELINVNIRPITDEGFDGNYDKLDADAVVIGLDRLFSYRRLAMAAHLLRKKKEAIFVLTNADTTFPEQGNRVSPDAGSFAAALVSASGRPVDVSVGKPGPVMFEQLAKRGIHIDPKRVLIVGDRCETDIEFAASIGGHSILVLTGISTVEEAQSYAKSSRPDEAAKAPNFIAPSVELLNNLLSN